MAAYNYKGYVIPTVWHDGHKQFYVEGFGYYPTLKEAKQAIDRQLDEE